MRSFALAAAATQITIIVTERMESENSEDLVAR